MGLGWLEHRYTDESGVSNMAWPLRTPWAGLVVVLSISRSHCRALSTFKTVQAAVYHRRTKVTVRRPVQRYLLYDGALNQRSQWLSWREADGIEGFRRA